MWECTYDIENGSFGVGGELVLGGVSNKTFVIGEGYPRRCDTVTCRGHMSVWMCEMDAACKRTLVVGDDLNLSVLHNTDTRVCGSQIDTNDGAGDSIAVVLDGFLVLGVCCLSQHQTANEDEEKVEGDGPC